MLGVSINGTAVGLFGVAGAGPQPSAVYLQVRVDGAVAWTNASGLSASSAGSSTEVMLQLDHLPDGQHTLEARAVHVSAGPDATPSKVTWVIRSQPPTVQIVRGPASSSDTPSSSATFLVQTPASAAAGRTSGTTTLLYLLFRTVGFA
jgi:hypothetical protein